MFANYNARLTLLKIYYNAKILPTVLTVGFLRYKIPCLCKIHQNNLPKLEKSTTPRLKPWPMFANYNAKLTLIAIYYHAKILPTVSTVGFLRYKIPYTCRINQSDFPKLEKSTTPQLKPWPIFANYNAKLTLIAIYCHAKISPTVSTVGFLRYKIPYTCRIHHSDFPKLEKSTTPRLKPWPMFANYNARLTLLKIYYNAKILPTVLTVGFLRYKIPCLCKIHQNNLPKLEKSTTPRLKPWPMFANYNAKLTLIAIYYHAKILPTVLTGGFFRYKIPCLCRIHQDNLPKLEKSTTPQLKPWPLFANYNVSLTLIGIYFHAKISPTVSTVGFLRYKIPYTCKIHHSDFPKLEKSTTPQLKPWPMFANYNVSLTLIAIYFHAKISPMVSTVGFLRYKIPYTCRIHHSDFPKLEKSTTPRLKPWPMFASYNAKLTLKAIYYHAKISPTVLTVGFLRYKIPCLCKIHQNNLPKLEKSTTPRLKPWPMFANYNARLTLIKIYYQPKISPTVSTVGFFRYKIIYPSRIHHSDFSKLEKPTTPRLKP